MDTHAAPIEEERKEGAVYLEPMMDKGRIWNKAAWGLSLLLGQVSALLGVMLTLGYLFAFALVLPNKAAHWSSGPRGSLYIEPPLIGLARDGLGLLIARCGRVHVARFSVEGLISGRVPVAVLPHPVADRGQDQRERSRYRGCSSRDSAPYKVPGSIRTPLNPVTSDMIA